MQSCICWDTGCHPCKVSKEREPPALDRGAKVFQSGPLHNFGILDEVSPMNLEQSSLTTPVGFDESPSLKDIQQKQKDTCCVYTDLRGQTELILDPGLQTIHGRGSHTKTFHYFSMCIQIRR